MEPARGNFTPPGRGSGVTVDEAGATAPPAGSRLSPSNWRVRTRLNAILLIPVLVALVVGGFNVKDSVDRYQQADDAERTAKLVVAASAYSHALIDERDRSVVPLLKGDTKNSDVVAARATTDAAANAFNAAVAQMPDAPDLKRRLASFRQVEPKLAALRQAAYTSKLPAVQTEEGYVQVQHPLMEFANDLGFGTNNLTSYGRTLYAISLAKAAESLTRSIGMHVMVEGPVPESERRLQLTALSSYAYLENIALQEYEGGGTPADMQRLQDANDSATQQGKQQLADAKSKAQAAGQPFVAPPDRVTMVKAIASGESATALRAQGITPQSWWASSTLAFNAYRTVESGLANQAESDAASVAADAKSNAIINSAAVLAGVLLAFVVAALMARSMSRSMRRLRTSAFEVAEQRLPALVDQLSRTDPGRVDTRVAPIPINTRDEIGEVARAFDQVHREAVRLAAEQALLRGNVNAIFTNLSVRNQDLIQRQLSLITELENNEADPDQLENLFQLDHLATRMRRNGENLLVLAGEEPGRSWNQPVPLVDVLRAAAAEVEDYERIELTSIPEVEIHGAAVTDLVHLLAELLENATTFSSPQTRVKVTATRLPDGRVMVEIHDKGIGLTAEDFADINHKLADPPTVDASISQRMGLFVVGRLADRHSIRVQLRPSGEQAGTTSLVMLPEPITHGGGGEEPSADDFTVSRIVPEHQADDFHAGQFTAAELGFDDRAFEVPDDARALDPISRQMRREERRAALEAAAGERQQADHRPLFRDEVAPAAEPEQAARQPYQPEPSYDPESSYQPGSTYQPEPSYDPERSYPGFEQPVPPVPNQYTDEFAVPQQPSHGTDGQPSHGYRPEDEFTSAPWQPEYPQDGWSAPASQSHSSLGAAERVGYDAPEAEPTSTPSLTDAGLPRRNRQWQQPEPAAPQRQDDALADGPVREQGGDGNADDWRSANDEHWQRAEQVRAPKAGGVTSSGLPRRVPKANLVPGAAHQTPQGGPQVSRAPEDVRGRLSNLRRGIQQGRNAGTDSPTDSQGLGPNHQER